MCLVLTIVANLLILTVAGREVPESSYNLRLISVVFRHGDRAPDPVELFPKDPNFGSNFYPMGLGGLTNKGKLRVYNLGRLLRRKYNDFLGETYLPNTVEARSTDYVRTKQCLQLVLSSLYPPQGSQRWHETLVWQPIASSYEKRAKDFLMIPEDCPLYQEERERAVESPPLKSKIKSFDNFMEKLSELTGKNITTPNDMYNLYHILIAEQSMDFTMPTWTKNYFPDGKLLDGINLEYEIFSYTPRMRRLNGGMLLKKIVEDMKNIKEKKSPENRKAYLYSGHETNIAALLQTLNLFQPHVPAYTSAVIVEMYERKSEFFVKLLYYKGIPDEVEELTLKNCEEYCQLEKFVLLNQDVIPEGDEMICTKPLRRHDETTTAPPTTPIITARSSGFTNSTEKLTNEIPTKRPATTS